MIRSETTTVYVIVRNMHSLSHAFAQNISESCGKVAEYINGKTTGTCTNRNHWTLEFNVLYSHFYPGVTIFLKIGRKHFQTYSLPLTFVYSRIIFVDFKTPLKNEQS
jgi:hypothetical protein